MMSNTDKILLCLETALPEVVFTLSGDGCHFQVSAIGECFVGLRKLQRQKMLNKILAPFIEEGSIHAVNYTLQTPAEIQQKEG